MRVSITNISELLYTIRKRESGVYVHSLLTGREPSILPYWNPDWELMSMSLLKDSNYRDLLIAYLPRKSDIRLWMVDCFLDLSTLHSHFSMKNITQCLAQRGYNPLAIHKIIYARCREVQSSYGSTG